ncbi:MAG: hypothetical protein WAM28_07735, partial [Chlamydiales bacterium]
MISRRSMAGISDIPLDQAIVHREVPITSEVASSILHHIEQSVLSSAPKQHYLPSKVTSLSDGTPAEPSDGLFPTSLLSLIFSFMP